VISAVFLLLAVVLDRLLGEPRRWHPLVGYGYLVRKVEHALYPAAPQAEPVWRMRCAACWASACCCCH
jgi:adenosylcobinamide-phosphate synthase